MSDEKELIFAYTRAQAIEDGVLVDVSSTAWRAMINYPVALTRAVWCQYVEVPEGIEGQDEAGRLWDLLSTLLEAIRWWNVREPGDALIFQLNVRNDREPKLVTLKAVCGPDDDGSPCITVMEPDES
jgi:hypothetical protein